MPRSLIAEPDFVPRSSLVSFTEKLPKLAESSKRRRLHMRAPLGREGSSACPKTKHRTPPALETHVSSDTGVSAREVLEEVADQRAT
jgi:hypothetical protein